MSPLSCRNSDLIPEDTSLVDKGRELLLHRHRAATAADISGGLQQFLDGDKFHVFVRGSLCGFLKIKLAADRDTEDIDTCPLSSGDQCFEDLLWRHAQCVCRVEPAEILFVVFIKSFPAWDTGLFYDSNCVGFSRHMITDVYYTTEERIPQVRIKKNFGDILGKKGGHHMENRTDAEMKEQEREQIRELGSDITRSEKGNIYTLTIIGQVEGHQVAPDTVKTTKYEHVLPLLSGIEESDDIDGLLLLLNTVGGDIEAGLAIAEMIAGMKKPTVSLVLGGGHSIGIPLAVCTKKSFITPTASMTVHPVRMTGLVVGAPQTFRYFQRIQEQIADFVTANSRISRKDFEQYMMATGEMATDVGTILYGKEAVASGLIDKMGGISDALAALHKMIRKQKEDKK